MKDRAGRLLLVMMLIPALPIQAAPKKKRYRPPPVRTVAPEAAKMADPLAPLGRLLGEWVGSGTDLTGPFDTRLSVGYAFLLEGRFIARRWEKRYRNREGGAVPPVERGIGYYGFDAASGQFTYSVFMSDGVSLHYAGRVDNDREDIVFDLVSGVNVPAGFRARMSTTFGSPSGFRELYEWSPTGRELSRYMEISYARAGVKE